MNQPSAPAQQSQSEGEPQQDAQPIPENNEGSGDEGQNDAFAVSLRIKGDENEAYAEVSLDEVSYTGFFAAIMISNTDATTDINDQQFLTQGQLAALAAGTGNSAELPMPSGMSEDAYAQVLILDDQGQLWAGPVKRLGDLMDEEAGDA
ncbi:MAG: hypothetical protein ACYTG5_01935 [Planctomycetota bacterium]|jgi:hypothetical protein